uniref:Uncharacterized protein n=1 Tax=Nelumbo nucifera TaxID=4432 RepID=A0A822YS00_NELNU|nr:TPA_asm: hypothetical protein HUJ06_012676 [Nelumbo nucifera]
MELDMVVRSNNWMPMPRSTMVSISKGIRPTSGGSHGRFFDSWE